MGMVKKITFSSILVATLVSPAQAELTGNVTLTSDYIFRGFTQTDQKPAIQGGFDYAHEATGVYAGIWASNVDLGGSVSIEVDYLLGVTGEFAGIGWDLGAVYYDYPSDGAQDFDYAEYKVGLSWNFLSAEYYYSDDFFGTNTEDAHYFSLGADFDLPMELSLSLHGGHQIVDGSGGVEYNDWSVGISRNVQGVDLGLTYTDTNGVDDRFNGGSCSSLCDSRILFSISKQL